MAQVVHVRLDLRVEHESISGSVCDQRGQSASFVGWLGLIALIERAQAELGASHEVKSTGTAPPAVRQSGEHQQDDD